MRKRRCRRGSPSNAQETGVGCRWRWMEPFPLFQSNDMDGFVVNRSESVDGSPIVGLESIEGKFRSEFPRGGARKWPGFARSST